MSYRREVLDTWRCDGAGCSSIVQQKHQHPRGAVSLRPELTPRGWAAVTVNNAGFEITTHYCQSCKPECSKEPEGETRDGGAS